MRYMDYGQFIFHSLFVIEVVVAVMTVHLPIPTGVRNKKHRLLSFEYATTSNNT